MLKKPKLKIAFDIDGVLCNFTHELISRLRDYTQTDISFEPEEYYFLSPWMDFFADQIGEGLFADCFPYETSEIYVNNLLENEEYEIHMITARGTEQSIYWTPELKRRVKEDTELWLKTYFPKFKHANLHFTHKKDEKIQELGIDVFVEDRKDTAEKVVKVCTSFLITRSWNTGETDLEVRRIGSLLELDYHLEGIIGGKEEGKQERKFL